MTTSTPSVAASSDRNNLLDRLKSLPGQVWMVLAMISFAVGNVYDQAATQHLNRPDPVVAAAVQALPVFLYGLIGWLVFMSRRNRTAATVETAEVKSAKLQGAVLFGIGGVITQIGTAAFFQGLIVSGFLGLSVVLPFVQTWELLAIIMGLIFLREKPTWALWVGMVIVITGLAGVAIANNYSADLTKIEGWYWAMPLGLVAAVCWAGASVLARAGMRRGVTPFGGLAVQYACGGLGAVFIVALQGHMEQFGKLDGNVLLYVLGGAVINGILATGFLTFALRVSPAHKVLPINAVYPAFAVILGALFLGNPISLWAFVSLLVVAFGLAFTQLGAIVFKKG